MTNALSPTRQPIAAYRPRIMCMGAPTDEQRRSFEGLCGLRGIYLRRGPADSVGVMSVTDAIDYAEALLATWWPSPDEADRSADSTV